MSDELVVYGVPFSQPVRAVLWLLLYKQHRFELSLVNPGSKGERGSRHPDYLAMNPGGTIPAIREPDSGFVLAEAPAIMTYLCQRHGWRDVYPEDLQQRAKVDWSLHYHHRHIRPASILIVPRVRKDLNVSEVVAEQSQRTFLGGLKTINDGWLAQSRFLVGDHVTIADFMAYSEIGQLQSCFTNLFDFSEFPNVQRWLGEMRSVDSHDDVHTVLSELGDISREVPTMDTLKAANKSALRVLKAKIEAMPA